MEQRRKLLWDSVELLAKCGEDQLAHLRELGILGLVDELALEFDDIAAAADDMLRRRELTQAQYDAVTALGRQLQEMTNVADVSLWSEVGLMQRVEWEEVRVLAHRIMIAR